jgi:hypothetical protein
MHANILSILKINWSRFYMAFIALNRNVVRENIEEYTIYQPVLAISNLNSDFFSRAQLKPCMLILF